MTLAALHPIARQLGFGLAIFAAVLAASLPLAFISEGLALGAAVVVASVMIALLARRLRIALMIAALLAVLGAFGAAHSIHIAVRHAPEAQRLAALVPAAGIIGESVHRAAAYPLAVMMSSRAEFVRADGSRGALPLPGFWAFPAALFVLWALGYGLVVAARAAARRLNRALDAAV